jgi:hypothetical protein
MHLARSNCHSSLDYEQDLILLSHGKIADRILWMKEVLSDNLLLRSPYRQRLRGADIQMHTVCGKMHGV